MPVRKYRIEYLATEGWGIYDPKYTKMDRAECAKELEYLAKQITKISRSDYEENISYYKDVVKKLKDKKGIE